MDTQIPLTYEGATRQLRVLQRKGIQIGLNQVIESAIVDFAQGICDEGLEGRYVTVHYNEDGLTITDDANNELETSIPAPGPGHSFQTAFRNTAPQLMRYLEQQVHDKLSKHQIH
ncbi:hypothetical protein FC83_GL003251 [Agrilactobacillus composti DSM 18527 = JCM 14202]|jgi:hypothetical protein|uniref:Uncharacterized protein n=1 Tax=Agrilactobacillus composti DSM 18527 = JCM 14202 TaxID=1423734 RepID=X0PCX2_9LACO|nr:hypothetical protein [Agrilactobacillus composti]KRM33170.1 hypothetical protein FC83_GL003251 [Agrilactobacillus composti DSM 18527 = JCM 14202]MCH4171364.1 hypothetical protein [Lactobacillus sp.]GAF38458.1 hypothetical protein JCM14202_269 [Agrilactobacillus composti DSM 18527 = JCM 14202]